MSHVLRRGPGCSEPTRAKARKGGFQVCGNAPRGPAASCLDASPSVALRGPNSPIQELVTKDRLIRVLDASIFRTRWIGATVDQRDRWDRLCVAPVIVGSNLGGPKGGCRSRGTCEGALVQGPSWRFAPEALLADEGKSPQAYVLVDPATNGMRLRCARRKANRGPRPSRPSRQRSAPAQQEADRQS